MQLRTCNICNHPMSIKKTEVRTEKKELHLFITWEHTSSNELWKGIPNHYLDLIIMYKIGIEVF